MKVTVDKGQPAALTGIRGRRIGAFVGAATARALPVVRVKRLGFPLKLG
jgi:hypothetical protein